ncbi:hypothetical protein AALA24_13970 [Anaerovoracaceae bacterium 42-11]|nr:hypothetical protein [Emergencia sp.]
MVGTLFGFLAFTLFSYPTLRANINRFFSNSCVSLLKSANFNGFFIKSCTFPVPCANSNGFLNRYCAVAGGSTGFTQLSSKIPLMLALFHGATQYFRKNFLMLAPRPISYNAGFISIYENKGCTPNGFPLRAQPPFAV